MWVDALELMIQDEGDELLNKKISECAKVAMSEVVETEFIF